MQHINLYGQLDRAVELPFSAKQQLMIVTGVALLMLAIYVVMLLGQNGLKSELQQLQQQQEIVSAEIDQLKARRQQLQDDPTLDKEIDKLEQTIAFRRTIIANLDTSETGSQRGFAEYLSGLARQQMNGLWFTAIQLDQGGRQMSLVGQTRKPEFLPQYLQKLSNETVFTGQQFRVLRMSTPEEQQDILNFEVRAKEVALSE